MIRLTPTGGVALVLLSGLGAAALRLGDNLLVLGFSGLLALIAVDLVRGAENVRGLTVARLLPSELVAGVRARGAFGVTRERGRSYALDLVDGGDAGTVARAHVSAVSGEIRVPADWRLPSRGMARLREIRISSVYPFGLFHWTVHVPSPAQVVVFPLGRSGGLGARRGSAGAGQAASRDAGNDGDFEGLRAYQPGHSVRDIHWPSSARSAAPLVIVRGAERQPAVIIAVDEARGEAWEVAIGRATGAVERHFSGGRAVGLQVEGRLWPARAGAEWRRRLLTELACLSVRS